MPITPYGNAEAGDYPALFSGAFEAKYPKAKRLIFGFAILTEDRDRPRDGPRPWENVSAEAAGALYPAGVGAETPIDRLARVT